MTWASGAGFSTGTAAAGPRRAPAATCSVSASPAVVRRRRARLGWGDRLRGRWFSGRVHGRRRLRCRDRERLGGWLRRRGWLPRRRWQGRGRGGASSRNRHRGAVPTRVRHRDRVPGVGRRPVRHLHCASSVTPRHDPRDRLHRRGRDPRGRVREDRQRHPQNRGAVRHRNGRGRGRSRPEREGRDDDRPGRAGVDHHPEDLSGHGVQRPVPAVPPTHGCRHSSAITAMSRARCISPSPIETFFSV